MLWFVVRIFILLYAGSIVVGLVGWEGLGISRFFLVAFRRSRSSLSGANITIITNRIGDIGYLLAIRYIWQTGYSAVWCVSLLLAALTKRSQYPFSSWLPAAMAAPTPVSRLVHSSTLVTAGIFLLLRHGFAGFTLLSLVGSLTMVGGGIVALLGQDAKKNRGSLNVISTRAYNLLSGYVLRTTDTQSSSGSRLLQKIAIYVRWRIDSQYLWDARKSDRL